MERKNNVMRKFLDAMVDSRTRTVIIMKNGYQMGGWIAAWDEISILVDVDGINRLVMISAVSTIIPKE